MNKSIVIKHDDGQIALGAEHPMFGFVPVLVFADWSRFREFIVWLRQYYDEYHPRIPAVFLKAFEEKEEEGC